MKILLIGAGSLGDIEYILAIEELLRDKGHEVICAFPEQFKNLVDESNARFISIGSANAVFLESEELKTFLRGKGSIFKKISAYRGFAKASGKMGEEVYAQTHRIIKEEKPDKIIFNWIATYPLGWGINNPNKSIFVSPAPCYIHHVKSHADMIFHGNNYGSFLNRLTYVLANFMWSLTFKGGYNGVDEKIPKITLKQAHNAILSSKIVYAVSPSIFPRPDYWPDNAHVLGHNERTNGMNEIVDEDLKRFIAKHDKILFITFGSMTNPESEENTEIFLDILQKHQIPAIINTASGGLMKPTDYDSDLIHFVNYVPYHWILPKVHSMIHHGGSGTTHLALKYGCSSMIVPHMIDQYVWNNVVSDLGAGPKGVAIGKLTKKNIEPKLLDLFQNESYKIKAMEISEKMKKEDFKGEFYRAIIE